MKVTSYAMIPAMLAACVQPALASGMPELAQGGRVRLTLSAGHDKRLKGTVVTLDERVLWLRVDGRDQPVALDRAVVSRIEVSRGRCGGCALGLGLAGGVVGLGAAAAALFTWFPPDNGQTYGGEWLLVLPVLGAVAGAHLGGRERWRIQAPGQRSVELRVEPKPRGMGVSVALGF